MFLFRESRPNIPFVFAVVREIYRLIVGIIVIRHYPVSAIFRTLWHNPKLIFVVSWVNIFTIYDFGQSNYD